MPEQVIYRDHSVSISSNRIVISGTSYAMRNIASVKMTSAPAKKGLAVALVVLGAVIFAGGLALDHQRIPFGLLGGAMLFGLGLLWLRSCGKAKYFVTIEGSSGQRRALTSRSKFYVEKIVNTINDAIIQYR